MSDDGSDQPERHIGRRTLLQALGVIGLTGYASATGSASPSGQLGTDSRPVKSVFTQRLGGGITGGTVLDDLTGAGLTINDGTLQTAVTGGENLTDAAAVFAGNADGTLGFRTLRAGSNVSISEYDDEIAIEASTSSGGESNDGSNLGTGTGVYGGKSGSTLEFRSLVGGTNVTLGSADGEITIDASGAGEANDGTNLGTGTGLYGGKSGSTLEFRSLSGGSNVSLSNANGEVTIDASDTGEANTASNAGTGTGVFHQKSGVDLEFRSLVAGSNVALTHNSGDITIDATDTGEANSGTSLGAGTPVYAGMNGTDLEFRSLVGGSNVSLSTASGELTIDATDTGEANTASNVGTGAGVFKQKSGADLEFRSLTGLGAISTTENTDEVAVGGPWADGDADGLLEPRSGTGYTGIDLTGVTGAKLASPWVGTRDATPFQQYVNATRVGRFDPTGTDLNGNTAAGNVLLGQYAEVARSPVGVSITGGGTAANDDVNRAFDDYATIAGGSNNRAGVDDTSDQQMATIGGGFSNTASAADTVVSGGAYNTASGDRTTVGGGANNSAQTRGSTVGGGEGNTAKGNDQSTVAGGLNNTASGWRATVGGGNDNGALNDEATVSGGLDNHANGRWATIPGGRANGADADYAFAAGYRARAKDTGSFVWADSTNADFASNQAGTGSSPTGPDTFHVRSVGGLRLVTGLDSNNDPNAGVYLSAGGSSWQTVSARSKKHDVTPVEPETVLDGVTDLDVSTWAYDSNPGVRHMGPMAGEFHEVFDLGDDPETIGHVDIDGVALAAIQGLAEKLDAATDRVDDLETDLQEADDRVEALESELEEKDDRIDSLEAEREAQAERLDDLEARLAALEASNEEDDG